MLRSAEPTFPLARLRVAEQLTNQAVTAMLGQSSGASRSAVAALAAAIDARDNYTHEHSEQVVKLACEVAERLGLPESEVERVRDGAMLHDVGKVAIPNEVLFKDGPLDEREWAVMREHPAIGERILRRTPELASNRPAGAPRARALGRRWATPTACAAPRSRSAAGSSWPATPINAMITARPYRAPMSEEMAMRELGEGSGHQFDPTVVSALMGVPGREAGSRLGCAASR